MKKSDLKKYAKLIVRIGANVQKGQDVIITSNVECAEFAKMLVEEAYKAKARLVTVDWDYDPVSLITYKKASTETLCDVPNWKVEKLKYMAEKLPAKIYVDCFDPNAFDSVDQDKLTKINSTVGKVFKPYWDQMDNKYQWVIAAVPHPIWAQKVFPNETKKTAIKKLWDAIFLTARVNGDPIKNWQEHNANLQKYTNKLNSLNIKTLIYNSKNGTDFSIDLLEQTVFEGGVEKTIGGIPFNPNMPSEEVYTSPDPKSANGVVYSTKPLSVNGKLVEDFGFRFKDGVVTEVLAKNEEHKKVLENLISTDEFANRLGEVALVSYDSPINNTGILFYNTLFDENTCCHLALGAGFDDTIKGFEKMTEEEKNAVGINDSIIHEDFMIGTPDLSIIAKTRDGKTVQIFKDGSWAI